MYHFVKIHFIAEDKYKWYLKPESLDDVEAHFNTIVNKDISMGIKEHINSTYIVNKNNGEIDERYDRSSDTDWKVSVMSLVNIYGTDFISTSKLLMETTKVTRIRSFNKYKDKIYFANGLQIFFWPNTNDYCEITEEFYSDELEYPIETHKHFADVVYTNIHLSKWTAKIGNHQVEDKNGKTWWYSKKEAQSAASWFCQNLEWKLRNTEES